MTIFPLLSIVATRLTNELGLWTAHPEWSCISSSQIGIVQIFDESLFVPVPVNKVDAKTF